MNNRHNEHLGINKLGKNIRKSPLHQPNFVGNNNSKPQPPQPHVYNISKNDFRNIVQQLTGSPSHNQPSPRPPINPPKPPSMRLQRIRPPPLTPIARPHHNPQTQPGQGLPPPHFNNGYHRPPPPHMAQQPQYPPVRPPGEAGWSNTAESPISAYMRYLQNSMEPTPRPPFQGQNQHPPHPHSQLQPPPPMQGLLPNPPMSSAFLSPQGNGAPFPPFPSPRGNGAPFPPFPSPRGNGAPFPSPRGNGAPFPSPRGNGPALLPSPTSQFLLPSPSAYGNLLSPRSPYPFSPGFQFPPPLTPGFFSPLSHQQGLLGPGPQAPPSPGMMFPQSPSGFFPFSSPRWRD